MTSSRSLAPAATARCVRHLSPTQPIHRPSAQAASASEAPSRAQASLGEAERTLVAAQAWDLAEQMRTLPEAEGYTYFVQRLGAFRPRPEAQIMHAAQLRMMRALRDLGLDDAPAPLGPLALRTIRGGRDGVAAQAGRVGWLGGWRSRVADLCAARSESEQRGAGGWWCPRWAADPG